MRQIYLILLSISIFLSLIQDSEQNGRQIMNTVENLPRRSQEQIFIDLFLLKNSSKILQENLDQAIESLQEQSKIIRELQMKYSQGDNVVDDCEVTEQFLELDSGMIKIKQKLQRVINENDDLHMEKLDKIMHNVRRISLECSMDGQELFVAFQTNITAKLNKFNSQIARLEELEQRFVLSEQEENRLENQNSEFTVLLNAIMDKLISQERKLENMELNLPLMVNATESMIALKKDQDKVCNKQKCISKKILDLTKTQEDVGNV